jgi:hypothetical protein
VLCNKWCLLATFVQGKARDKMSLVTCVHFFRPECNTAMRVMVYYIPPGVRILHSPRFPEDRNRASALQQGKIHG